MGPQAQHRVAPLTDLGDRDAATELRFGIELTVDDLPVLVVAGERVLLLDCLCLLLAHGRQV